MKRIRCFFWASSIQWLLLAGATVYGADYVTSPADEAGKGETLRDAEVETEDETTPIQRLPVREAYQGVLRDYLASLTADDFRLPPGRFTYEEDYLSDPDAMFRTWLAMNDGYGLSTRGIYDLAPEAFTLAGIETPEGTRLQSRAALFPASMLFFSDWDYPGNPLYDSRALRNRVLAFCIVDMLNLDALHNEDSLDSRRVRRSDYLGGTLAWHAMTYARMKNELPAPVADAFEEGLGRFVDRMHEWGAPGGLGNMTSMGLVAMAHIEEHADDPDLAERARGFAQRIVEVIAHPSGYVTDGAGTDISYNGLALYHMAWAARHSEWDFLDDAVCRLLVFMNAMTLPEPDGNHWGPSHFSVRTSADAANDQWAFTHRQFGLALGWPELAAHLVFERHRAPARRVHFPDEESMRKTIDNRLGKLNSAVDTAPEDVLPQAPTWSAQHWDVRYNWAWQFYRKGQYAMLRKAEAERPDWTRVPMARNEDWRQNLAEEIVLRRTPGYAAIVHAGRIGRYREYIYGLGGGTLSAFWTPEGGSLLLGRRRGHQHDNPDRLDEWRIWPVHALSGETTDGKIFTSARVRFPRKNVDEREDGAVLICLAGSIGDRLSAPDEALAAPIEYERKFVLGKNTVEYHIRISGKGLAQVAEMAETIPVFLRDGRRQPEVETSITFVIDNREIAATGEAVRVEAVRIRRFAGGAEIVFDRPRIVRLSPEVWRDTYQSRVEQRNILIDLTPGENREQPLAYGFTIAPLQP